MGFSTASTVEEGVIQYMGTIEIDVTSRETTAVINLTGERIFDTLNQIRIVDDFERDNNVRDNLKSTFIKKNLAVINATK